MSVNKPLLETHDLSIPGTSIDNLSLSVDEGEVIGVLGGTSVGKTSLLLSILRLRKYRGKILYKGVDIEEIPKADYYKEVLLAPEQPEQAFIANTVANEVAYQLEEWGLDSSEISKRVWESLELLGLRDYAWHPIQSLSGGLKRRVLLASIIAARPKLILMDAPYSDLDPPMRKVLTHVINDMLRTSAGILITGSKRRELRVADKLIEIRGDALPQVSVEPFLKHIKSQSTHLRVRDLRFRYRGNTSFELRGISFEHTTGEPLIVLGCNGAGKTTLGKILAGLLRPLHGLVKINEANPGHYVSTYVYQDPEEGFFGKTLLEDLAINFKIKGLERGEAAKLAKEILDSSGLGILADKPIFTLSRGIKKLYSILAALILSPRLIVFDEPTNNIDEKLENIVVELIRTVSRRILTVVITHDLEFAYKLGGTAIVLRNGVLKLVDKTRSIKEEDY